MGFTDILMCFYLTDKSREATLNVNNHNVYTLFKYNNEDNIDKSAQNTENTPSLSL